MLSLHVEKRRPNETVAAIRNRGAIPAVVYGPKQASTPITILEKDFRKIFKQAGETTVVSVEGVEDHAIDVLIHEVDTHPVTGAFRHTDLYALEKGKKVEVKIPLEFVGESEAVKSLGGTLVKVLHEVEIEAFPKDLPHGIDVDIAALTTLESQILAQDLKMPAGVTLITKPEEVVAAITVAKEEPVEEVARDISDIEISEERGKKEDAEGGEAAESKDEKGDK
jgi:large subunit ribosomal protein L25